MLRLFLDYQDSESIYRDDTGSEVERFEQARDQVIDMLQHVATDQWIDGAPRVFRVEIRNEEGEVLYCATLTFSGERLQSSD